MFVVCGQKVWVEAATVGAALVLMHHVSDQISVPGNGPWPAASQVGLGLWGLSLAGRSVNAVTLLLALHLAAFTLPAAYKLQKAKVDALVADAYGKAQVRVGRGDTGGGRGRGGAVGRGGARGGGGGAYSLLHVLGSGLWGSKGVLGVGRGRGVGRGQEHRPAEGRTRQRLASPTHSHAHHTP